MGNRNSKIVPPRSWEATAGHDEFRFSNPEFRISSFQFRVSTFRPAPPAGRQRPPAPEADSALRTLGSAPRFRLPTLVFPPRPPSQSGRRANGRIQTSFARIARRIAGGAGHVLHWSSISRSPASIFPVLDQTWPCSLWRRNGWFGPYIRWWRQPFRNQSSSCRPDLQPSYILPCRYTPEILSLTARRADQTEEKKPGWQGVGNIVGVGSTSVGTL